MRESKEQIPKYLLYKDIIRVGWNINYHRELLPPDFDRADVKGGGRVNLKEEERSIIFYGISADFNECKKEDFIKALPNSYFSPSLEGFKVFWAPYNKLQPEEAWAVAEEIGVIPS